ncbi:hypothetical protein ELI48_11530 [Rhizobium ruizarguesonis]|uniref:hypothetical protein n=1 Tax=Rhizobium ruizarguesonis TaxID=2081791 RepID=UPI00103130AB|nr:hypothetical protein [Rhizobium ruizarguesonis]TAU26726.1 hypothetical protein ELI48_11530 [Rhizobium ruizarguesonis]TAU68378.1 hypothetical protein ELI45_11425 [Rhizobium ruizarguesonis]TAW98372.1 hypothetical protein ELI12_10330 [Rhizobium ruizarguesonis]TAY46921.1 hypothetical protein ELH87_10535 [Rhizobium ruizarguesonis]TAY57514.1 hypothetical protein ELH88_10600 [Rhizobium ruizarguesonis]
MLYLCLAVCAMFLTFSFGRYLSARTRLVEKTIDETITRKLSASPIKIELARLKEENGVMRNLLTDMVENEASLAQASHMSEADRARAIDSRTARRREIFGEALLVLRRPGERSASRQFNI